MTGTRVPSDDEATGEDVPDEDTTGPDERGGTCRTDALDVSVFGVRIDAETRCVHYDTERDVVAIAFPCCTGYFSCIDCHRVLRDHEAECWPSERFDERAVLCGSCGTTLSIEAYLACEHRCPVYRAAFNLPVARSPLPQRSERSERSREERVAKLGIWTEPWYLYSLQYIEYVRWHETSISVAR